MKKCPQCGRSFPLSNRFCTIDGAVLVESQSGERPDMEQRAIPPPPDPLPMRMTIVDQSDEGHRSRVINGQALDVSHQGMRIKTGTIETGRLNVIRDHTIAFKNLLDVEIDLPSTTIHLTGFAAWYKPAEDGMNWTVGVYIRNMATGDRKIYDDYLKELSSQNGSISAPAGSGL